MEVVIIPKIEDRCNKIFHEFDDFDFCFIMLFLSSFKLTPRTSPI